MITRCIILIICLGLAGELAAQTRQAGVSQRFGNFILGPEHISNGTVNAVLAFKQLQQKADDHYAAERYDQAYKQYLELARFNDKFSQYRLSVMYFYGRGVEKSLADAYAWSYISAEALQKGYVNNHVFIRDQLTPQQLQAGKQVLDQYHTEHGTFAIASEARQLIHKGKRECVGSRLGNTCNRIGSFGTNCGLTSQGQLTRGCLVFGSVGLPGVINLQPVDIRIVENQLELMIDHYNPGFIELGDLEIIED